MYQRYIDEGGILAKHVFGKNVMNFFPKVESYRRYCSSIKKEQFFYKGIVNATVNTECVYKELTYVKQWVPTPFFVCKENDDAIHFATFCGTINDHNVTKEIVFHNNGTWDLYIGRSKVDVNECSVDNSFIISRRSIQDICCIVYKMHICNGKQKENVENVNVKYHLLEHLGPERKPIYRSFHCKRVIPFSFHSSTCRSCNSMALIKRKEESSACPSKKAKHHLPLPNKGVDDQDSVVLEENNDKDMKLILKRVLPEASGEMLDMLTDQKKNIARNPTGRRWDKKTIRLCLSLWCRSPKNYTILKDSKVLVLPSDNTLRIYKNSVDQHAGFNKDVFNWMKEAAQKHVSGGNGMHGGIALDEMSIQEDLCMCQSNGEVKLLGFVDMGNEAEYFERMCTGKSEKKLATHVLQFLYIGLNGFRFPFACFPVTQTKTGNLHFLFWKAVQHLNMYGFKVCFVTMDGAQTNRDFLKMFFTNSTPLAEKFSTMNIWSPQHPPIIFIMDYSHVIKRVRNNILKSGDSSTSVRHLCFEHPIFWEHWINAFKWDRDTNAFPIHHKLTNEHIYLNQQSKMRNKLAEDVLDKEMLYLMQCFQKFLGETGDVLEDSINLLKATSEIVAVFRDKRPITDVEDVRLDKLEESLSWFQNWEKHVLVQEYVPSAEKEKQLLSSQTREDLQSCIVGFNHLCKTTLKEDRSSIVPARINSDVIENIFCQQRGIINGNNTNPTFYQFVKNINSVIIGQSILSKTCNSGSGSLTPVCFNTKKSTQSRKSKCARKPLATLNV